jgi:small subunit ribosomal protein S13
MGSTRVKEEDAVKGEKLEEEKKEKVKHKAAKQQEIRTIIRVAGTDLDGEKSVFNAIRKIKGIGFSISSAVCKSAELDPNKKLRSLNENEIERLESVIREPLKFKIPIFLLNRRRDIETGKDMHLTGMDLTVAKKFDIQRYVDMKTYRGWRHMLGQPVRGQRTRSSFREKGKAVGVMKKEIKLAAKKAEEKEEK